MNVLRWSAGVAFGLVHVPETFAPGAVERGIERAPQILDSAASQVRMAYTEEGTGSEAKMSSRYL